MHGKDAHVQNSAIYDMQNNGLAIFDSNLYNAGTLNFAIVVWILIHYVKICILVTCSKYIRVFDLPNERVSE